MTSSRIAVNVLLCSQMLVVLSAAAGYNFFPNSETRRRLTTNAQSCAEVDYAVDEVNCHEFYDETFWTEDFLSSICSNDGSTDKQVTATLCVEYADNAEYVQSLKLAIMNTMYGRGVINPLQCGSICMYDPLNLAGADAVGFRWSHVDECWRVLTGATDDLCYDAYVDEWEHAIHKSFNFCPARICTAYGDPNVYSFYSNSMKAGRSIGDFVLYSSDTLRIDARFRNFVRNGQVSNEVSGVHATAIEVIGGDCDVKIEIYTGYRTESGELLFLFNAQEVGWSELPEKFSSCDEICPSLYEINEESGTISITFADQLQFTIKKVDQMQALWITAPYDAFYLDNTLLVDEQLCMEGYRRLNCDDDRTIFTHYDYVSESYITCEEVPDDTSNTSFDCDGNIETIADELCASCEGNCGIEALTESCSYDICAAPGVADAWNENNEELARAEAQAIADEYCEWAAEQIEDMPWICRVTTDSPTQIPTEIPPSANPTASPISQTPTASPSSPNYYIVQGKQQSLCEDITDTTCASRIASPDEIHGVRCCADSDPGGWLLNSHRGCNVFAQSNIPDCHMADYSSSVQLCSDVGGRLCTREELEYPNLCAANSGCGFNGQMVWSSTEGIHLSTVAKYYIVQGNSNADCLETSCTTRAVSEGERWNVRCCADFNPGDWIQRDGCSVYTESNIPNCVSTDWVSAVELCSSVGGRLCTREEIEAPNYCTALGGCGFDRYMIWSSTAEESS